MNQLNMTNEVTWDGVAEGTDDLLAIGVRVDVEVGIE